MRNTRNFARNGLIGTIALCFAATAGSAAYAAGDRTNDPSADAPHMKVEKSSDGEVKYCTRIKQTTGTILSRKVCKTAAEWEKVGVHVTPE
ncbi:hypothetical protein DFR49_1841 [Hephaestia caeni]|uniref:Uncharacterized protein n=2 Tax=Hephaestia caeni TaxID=645617 RepID=A0A397P8W8_9SPHN|nr:hypothetical protein DFR49_1841 [Hephaestia caeni]